MHHYSIMVHLISALAPVGRNRLLANFNKDPIINLQHSMAMSNRKDGYITAQQVYDHYFTLNETTLVDGPMPFKAKLAFLDGLLDWPSFA